MNHMFDVDVATRYGINAAVIFQNIAFWCHHSRANGTNYHDGLYWTYNSVKAFQDLFPYFGRRQIENTLQKLLEAGLIVKGNYNKLPYDRTMWYAVTELGDTMFRKRDIAFAQNVEMDSAEKGNGNAQKGQPIPYVNPDGKTNYYIAESFDAFYKAYPRKVSKPAAQRAWAKLKPDEALQQTILDDIARRRRGEWAGKDMQYIPHPSTYLNQRRWEDETAAKVEEEVEHDLSMEEIMLRGEDCSMPDGYTPCGGW